MRDQKERLEKIERGLKGEFSYALHFNLITQKEHDNYLKELNVLTSYIYEKYKEDFLFDDEDWIKINNYYKYIQALPFVREHTKRNLESIWLIEM